MARLSGKESTVFSAPSDNSCLTHKDRDRDKMDPVSQCKRWTGRNPAPPGGRASFNFAGGPRRRGNTDTVKLQMMGYRQELARELTLFNCFGCNFNVLSSFAALDGWVAERLGILLETGFSSRAGSENTFCGPKIPAGPYGIGIGFTYGGPIVMTWGWIAVMALTLSVGLSLAEMASAYPTSGALYYWSYKMAPPRLRNLTCFLTGWLMTLGQSALSASATYTFVGLVDVALEQQYGIVLGPTKRLGILLATLATVCILNCGSARVTSYLTTLGAFWHIIALLGFCFALLLLAPKRQPVEYVFTSWQSDSTLTGITSPLYTVLLGILMAQWSFTGYDGAAHVAEETLHAELVVPAAMLLSILGAGLCGFVLMLTLVVVKVDESIKFDPSGQDNMVLKMLVQMLDGVDVPFSSSGALFAMPIVGTYFCSFQALANNARMLYAFARDGGVPLSQLAARVHPGSRAPVWANVYMVAAAAALSIPMCFNSVVFSAVTSFAVLACYVAYLVPVVFKPFTHRLTSEVRPSLSCANNVLTVLWLCTVLVLFVLPATYPVSLQNCNWSGPMVLGVVALLLLWYYFPVYGAKTWFKGPRANLGQFRDVLPSEMTTSGGEAAAALRCTADKQPQRHQRLVEVAELAEEEEEEEEAVEAADAVAAAAAVVAAVASVGGLDVPAAAAAAAASAAAHSGGSSANQVPQLRRVRINRGSGDRARGSRQRRRVGGGGGGGGSDGSPVALLRQLFLYAGGGGGGLLAAAAEGPPSPQPFRAGNTGIGAKMYHPDTGAQLFFSRRSNPLGGVRAVRDGLDSGGGVGGRQHVRRLSIGSHSTIATTMAPPRSPGSESILGPLGSEHQVHVAASIALGGCCDRNRVNYRNQQPLESEQDLEPAKEAERSSEPQSYLLALAHQQRRQSGVGIGGGHCSGSCALATAADVRMLAERRAAAAAAATAAAAAAIASSSGNVQYVAAECLSPRRSSPRTPGATRSIRIMALLPLLAAGGGSSNGGGAAAAAMPGLAQLGAANSSLASTQGGGGGGGDSFPFDPL
ncbi:hypothetical protein VOLCADRAFT_96197 [Volvox carteri f. nagariensis]|uniref:Uncharacterized protein n=1 Tax=Volvox carteri f. nagariensis TaxID=3068 RepID=D8U9H1_VOLCA|nr:uncharacterized protein VOLCADRAFT_96197 [Volvox carteri f. nagariensis]EFJ43640.1 hypothetical protein VOLCADRAFT_96197 [Volvox carteri f. nagariensis]|eukprot:XP_002955340.1 hypothetical protein VOLCADRAFT_96197 [Volvox carteri f. nagariensis]